MPEPVIRDPVKRVPGPCPEPGSEDGSRDSGHGGRATENRGSGRSRVRVRADAIVPARMKRRRPSPLKRGLAILAVALALMTAGLAILWVTLPDPAPLARTAPQTTALIEQRRAEAAPGSAPCGRPAPGSRSTGSPATWWTAVLALRGRPVLRPRGDRLGRHPGRGRARPLPRPLRARRLDHHPATRQEPLAGDREEPLVRKAKEAVLAWKLERALPKRRILALYLNVVEWGMASSASRPAPGPAFGVAASRPLGRAGRGDGLAAPRPPSR